MELHHIAISVNDLRESIGFYEKHFGFTLDRMYEKPSGPRFCFLTGKAVRLELFEFKDRERPKDSQTDMRILGIRHIAFKVDDIKRKTEQLQKEGLQFDGIKDGTSCKYYTFTTDPNGVSIELFEAN